MIDLDQRLPHRPWTTCVSSGFGGIAPGTAGSRRGRSGLPDPIEDDAANRMITACDMPSGHRRERCPEREARVLNCLCAFFPCLTHGVRSGVCGVRRAGIVT